jgi:flagellar biosynthesis/type III secretory pathway chaperone
MAVALLCGVFGLLHAQVNVTTYHYDTARTGANIHETILTPANVNSTQFGKLFSVPVDNYVYAQPLYLSGVNIAGGVHNVLYVATENDSVYAIDADTGTLYAHASLIPAGGSPMNTYTDIGCGDIETGQQGITGTPVIDPTTGTLYVVALSKVNGAFFQYLHALDVTTLAEKFNGPVSIKATVPGTGYDSVGGSVVFSQLHENQRAALLLENGHVVIGWSSHCDYDPWHGWVISYNAGTLTQEAVFNASPNGSHSGVWMSGGGFASDANGNIYFTTGNGLWNGNADYGDSVVKLGPPANGSFPVLDYFTPYNQGTLNNDDLDISAGGLVLLPTLPSGRQLLAQQGKAGTIYLLDINNLGKYCVNLTPACSGRDPQIVQEIVGASSGIWGSPAYWNGYLYWTGANDSINAYSFNANESGLISTSPTSHSPQIFAFAAPIPTISSNGNTNGILWALNGSAANSTCASGADCLSLYAYDATNLANLLYSSTQAANNRDSPGSSVKFETPVIVNGHVYVGTKNSVVAYGLLAAAAEPAAVPTFKPATGTYTSAQSVTIADSTPGATIHFTTNGTTPTIASPAYGGGPITVSTSEILQAIAVANGYTPSAVGAAAYTISGGSTTTPVNDPTGFASATGLSLLGGAKLSGSSLELTDGGDTEARAVWYGTPVNVQNFTTDFSFQESSASADGFTFTIQNQGAKAIGRSGGGLGYSGIGSSVAVKFDLYSNAGEGPDSTGFYTGGATPTVPALDMSSSGVNLHGGDILHAHITYNGTTLTLLLTDTVTNASFTASTAINIPATVGGNTAYVGFTAGTGGESAVQQILNWTLVNSSGVVTTAAAIPTYSPVAGTYTSAQSVKITDSTPGATIYFTTNGTTPTTASPIYGGPITVSTSETLQAIAVASGYTTSAVGAASYTISTGSTTPVNDPTGFASAAGLSLVGGALVSGGSLELTDGGDTEARAAWFGTPVNVQNFTTDFSFQETSASADGFTFTIQNQGAQAIGHSGGGLGYSGIGSSVAVKFDLYSNAGEGIDSTGFYIDGASPTVPALDMTSSGVNLHSGDILHAHITYNGTTLTLTLTDTVTNASFTTSTAINIPATVGGNTAYVGFTAGTGGESAVQQILNWTLVNSSGVVTTAAAVPTYSPVAGTYTSAQSVKITDSTPGATIYFTTNGTTPTTASPVYGGPIAVSTSETLQAIAVASGYTTSAVGAASYTISSGSTTPVNYPTGFASAAGLSLVAGAQVSGGMLDLTSVTDWEARAAWYASPVNVQSFTTDFSFQETSASADGFTFTIQNDGAQALGHYGGGLGYEGIGSSVAVKFDLYSNAGEGIDSTGFYTGGATPTVPALDMTSSGVNLHSGDILHAHITYNGTTLTLTLTDTVTNASFTASTTINIPATVGGDTAYVGFTASTGGETSVQQILNWTFVVN